MTFTQKATYRALVTAVNATMKERSRRLGILKESTILPADTVINVESTVQEAIALLKERPEHILKWISEDEVALFFSMEEV